MRLKEDAGAESATLLRAQIRRFAIAAQEVAPGVGMCFFRSIAKTQRMFAYMELRVLTAMLLAAFPSSTSAISSSDAIAELSASMTSEWSGCEQKFAANGNDLSDDVSKSSWKER